eukprot:Em0018g1202a
MTQNGTKRVHNNYEDDDEGKASKIPKTLAEKDSTKRLIVILEKASLETVKVGKKFELLNCDDHKRELTKFGRDLSSCLLMLLDSPLNRAGLLQVYIHTEKNVLIEDVLQIIKNPISDHLPTGSRKIGTSFHSDKLVDIKTFATDKPIVFVVGSMAHGKVEVDYTEEEVSFSGYPLSAALTCSKLCSAFEEAWGIK